MYPDTFIFDQYYHTWYMTFFSFLCLLVQLLFELEPRLVLRTCRAVSFVHIALPARVRADRLRPRHLDHTPHTHTPASCAHTLVHLGPRRRVLVAPRTSVIATFASCDLEADLSVVVPGTSACSPSRTERCSHRHHHQHASRSHAGF